MEFVQDFNVSVLIQIMLTNSRLNLKDIVRAISKH